MQDEQNMQLQMDFISSKSYPDRQEAENLLSWAAGLNPGSWEAHSRTVARAAETIAAECGLNKDKAFVLGLLHDIGRYEGPRHLHHVYAGCKLTQEKGYSDAARVCLSHSFPYQNLGAYSGGNDCTEAETTELEHALSVQIYDDYDRLIQLCDCIGIDRGICLMDVRLLNVLRRHGKDGITEFMFQRWDEFFNIKAHFDEICGINIYDLFYDEIRAVSFE